jgi:hypothetical protein
MSNIHHRIMGYRTILEGMHSKCKRLRKGRQG